MDLKLFALFTALLILILISALYFLRLQYKELISANQKYTEQNEYLRKELHKAIEERGQSIHELQMLKSTDKKESYEVKELIHDLILGKALVEIKRIDPASVFMRGIKE